MPLTRVYKLLEQAQDELRAIDPDALPVAQQDVVRALQADLDAVVELAFLAGNAGEPQG